MYMYYYQPAYIRNFAYMQYDTVLVWVFKLKYKKDMFATRHYPIGFN